MTNKIHKFNLETDYKINGNSTGMPLDTLAIAVDGRDSNDIDENKFEAEDEAIEYVLEHYGYESDMLKTATKKQLEEWLKDSMHYIRQNEAYVAAGYWPQNDTACNQYNGCVFRPICGITPSLRAQHLKTLYTRRQWDPLVLREI